MLAFTSCCCVQREPGQEQVFPGSRTPEVPVAEIAFQPDSEKRTLKVLWFEKCFPCLALRRLQFFSGVGVRAFFCAV